MRTPPIGRRSDDLGRNTLSKEELTANWLPRYTGMPLENFGEYILLTNFSDYVNAFVRQFDCQIYGEGRPMQAATNQDGITIINFGIGSANAATIMDLLTAIMPKAVLFLGKCGGLKTSTEIGNFILPIAAIGGEGTSDDSVSYTHLTLPTILLV